MPVMPDLCQSYNFAGQAEFPCFGPASADCCQTWPPGIQSIPTGVCALHCRFCALDVMKSKLCRVRRRRHSVITPSQSRKRPFHCPLAPDRPALFVDSWARVVGRYLSSPGIVVDIVSAKFPQFFDVVPVLRSCVDVALSCFCIWVCSHWRVQEILGMKTHLPISTVQCPVPTPEYGLPELCLGTCIVDRHGVWQALTHPDWRGETRTWIASALPASYRAFVILICFVQSGCASWDPVGVAGDAAENGACGF